MERSKGENVRNFFLFILYYYYDKKCKVVNSTSLYHASLTGLGLKDSKTDSESLIAPRCCRVGVSAANTDADCEAGVLGATAA